jgi:hypothetical protein
MNLIERWAEYMELGPLSNNRRLALTLDRVRVHLLEIHPGQVIVQARLCDLPLQTTQRERTIERAGQSALARLQTSASVLTVDEDQSAFWLQQRVQGSDLQTLERAVEGLVNDIELWRAAL